MNVQSQSRYSVWGVLLVGLGVLFLINQFVPGCGLSRLLTHLVTAATFGFAAAMTYVAYTQNRQKRWLAFVAYGLGVLAGITLLDQLFPQAHDLHGAAVLFAIAAPFLYVFSMDRSKWWALIPGGLLGVIGVGAARRAGQGCRWPAGRDDADWRAGSRQAARVGFKPQITQIAQT